MGKFSFTQVTVHYTGKDAAKVLGHMMNDGPEGIQVIETGSHTTMGFMPNDDEGEDGDDAEDADTQE
jgi:hypothetical protein